MNSKIKEGAYGTIPMVVISSTYSDAAAMLSTGVPDYTYTVNGASKTVDIPRFIACRPATDSCLAVAMIYVIYKNNRWSTSYMDRSTQASRKCFGFFAGDTVASQAPAIGSQHTSVPIVNPVALTGSEPFNSGGAPLSAGSSLTGFNFKVPPGESCEEYLKGLEVAWARAAVDGGTSSYKYPQPSAAATPGDAIYTKVLEYAAAVTGVDPDVIEALAFKYSEYANHPTDAAFIETGGGPQRAWNAGEWVWSLIGLSAMCGYIPKKGGGIAGMSMSHFPEYLSFNSSGVTTPPIGSGGASNPVGAAGITIELCNWQHLVLTGKDHRDRAQIVNDVNYQFPGIGFTAADLPFKVDVIIHTNLNNIHTHPNTSKNAAAYKKVPTLIVIDQFMTPTARMADIILPATSHFELESYAIPTNTTGSTFIHREKIVDKLYDTKPEMEIQTILTEKLAARLGGAYSSVPPFSFAPFDFFSKEDYENVKITDYYKTYVQNIDLPTAEELKNREDGLFLLETSKDKPLLPMKDLIVPGNLDTSTGFLNFYSPLRAMRPPTRVSAGATASFLYKPGGWRNSTLSYQPLMQGREFYFDDANPTNGTLGNPLTGRFVGFKSPISGRTYKLQYMTNKSRNRGHTVFDSTAAIKDQFPQVVKMNPADAGARGIREGDAVYVYNDRGCMKLPANLSHSILPGIVSIEHGAWYRPHPTEKVKVWMQTDETEVFKEVSVPVDVGGADNILTNDYFGEDPVMCCGAVPAQAGPCEVSLTKPEDGGILI
jgi:anaerobic dimethyl sulfoxide reductase subunit A